MITTINEFRQYNESNNDSTFEMLDQHEATLRFLEQKKVPFMLRLSNRNNSMAKGKWFNNAIDGGVKSLAIGFWNGRDWKPVTPNIYFGVNETECFLYLTATDSQEKIDLFRKYLVEPLGLEEQTTQTPGLSYDITVFKKVYSTGTYLDNTDDFSHLKTLQTFLNGDYKIINQIIEENKMEFFRAGSVNPIMKLEDSIIAKNLARIKNDRDKLEDLYQIEWL